MACGLKYGVRVSSPFSGGLCLSYANVHSNVAASPSCDFKSWNRHSLFASLKTSSKWCPQTPTRTQIYAQAPICASEIQRWWEKSNKPNMVEIKHAHQLVSVLKNAGDRLVIVEFYSPSCGGCRALHPKICQLAESSPNAVFVKVNYDQLENMSQALQVRILPFFRLYRGADGEVCSFSCTNATINKLNNALAKYGGNRPTTGPAKGSDESEFLKLASNGEISLHSVPTKIDEKFNDTTMGGFSLPRVWSRATLAEDSSMAKV